MRNASSIGTSAGASWAFVTFPVRAGRHSFASRLRPSARRAPCSAVSLDCDRELSQAHAMTRNIRGFTLIELMITVAIVAILAAIAIPSYTEYVMRARITEATSNLADMRNKMEQFYQDFRSWAPAGPVQPCQNNTVAPTPTSTNFDFVCSRLGLNTYTVTATGKPGTTMQNFTYTINELNQRTSVGPAGWAPGPNCWIIKKDGSCA